MSMSYSLYYIVGVPYLTPFITSLVCHTLLPLFHRRCAIPHSLYSIVGVPDLTPFIPSSVCHTSLPLFHRRCAIPCSPSSCIAGAWRSLRRPCRSDPLSPFSSSTQTTSACAHLQMGCPHSCSPEPPNFIKYPLAQIGMSIIGSILSAANK